MAYFDCIITILGDGKLKFEYDNDKGGRTERDGKLGTDPIAKLTVRRMNEWLNFGLAARETWKMINVLEPDDLRVIGLNLYRILFGDPEVADRFSELYKRFAEQAKAEPSLRMRLRLVFEGKGALELSSLPWEFLYLPGPNGDTEHGFFFGEKEKLVLTRFFPPPAALPGAKLISEPSSGRALRILVAAYQGFEKMNSISEEHLNLVVGSIRAIAEPILVRNLPYRDLFQKLREEEPDIFHFVGHGEAGNLTLVKSNGDDDYDEGSPNQAQVRWTNARDFGRLFAYDPTPRLVFVHSCKGAQTAAQATLGVAQELVDIGIPAVIAMQHSITSSDAVSFAQIFYKHLAAGASIDDAVREGRLDLGTRNPPWGHPRFGSPVVYLRRDDILFQPAAGRGVEEPAAAYLSASAGVSPLPGSPPSAGPEAQPSRTASERAPNPSPNRYGVN